MKEEKKKEHWYRIHISECPVCGRGDKSRERVCGKKPEDYNEWYKYTEYYDYCLE